MFQMIRIWATFVRKSDGEPLRGDRYSVQLYDKDLLFDEKMGEARLDERGRAEFSCELADASSLDDLLETKPDLYVVLFEYGKEIFRSPVKKNVDFLKRDPVSNERNQLTQDLGTFRVGE